MGGVDDGQVTREAAKDAVTTHVHQTILIAGEVVGDGVQLLEVLVVKEGCERGVVLTVAWATAARKREKATESFMMNCSGSWV